MALFGVEININPVEGLKLIETIWPIEHHRVEININPVEGLKQALAKNAQHHQVEININPVEGLKPEVKAASGTTL